MLLADSMSSILQKAATSRKSINCARFKGFNKRNSRLLCQYLKKVFCLRAVIKLKEKVRISKIKQNGIVLYQM